MPQIIYDNTKTLDRDAIYGMKTCPSCGSVISLATGEVLDADADTDGNVWFKCPCGTRLPVKKYFGGKIYSDAQYASAISLFAPQIGDIMAGSRGLSQIGMGYGCEPFMLNHILIAAEITSIRIEAYVDWYRDFSYKEITDENRFHEHFMIDIRETLSLENMDTSLDTCAAYTQAMSDFIQKTLTESQMAAKWQMAPYKVEMRRNNLDAYLRGTNIDSSEIENLKPLM